mmetsp:Transcript_3426/g.10995  ORF Transcript_3426/g.10995 Transcript_3426/m.10995 type:complete len:221 (-) Transcript_3426:41-703(-)
MAKGMLNGDDVPWRMTSEITVWSMGIPVLGLVRLLLGGEAVEDAALPDGEQVVVRPLLHDDALLDDGDLVAVLDRRQPVRHRDRREVALLHDVVERRLHDALARVVERRRRLVEQQDRRLLDDGARNGDALLLAARQLAAAQAHLSVVAVAEALDDEFVRVRRARCGLHLLAGRLVLAERDVLRNGAHEEHRLLPDQPDLPAQRLDVHRPEVDAVDEHRP